MKKDWKKIARETAKAAGGVTALAKKIGVHRNLVHDWIRGRCRPNVDNAFELDALHKKLTESDDTAT